MYMARKNVFQISNIGTRSEKGSPPLGYVMAVMQRSEAVCQSRVAL